MLARVHQRPPPFVDCANSIWVSAGERSRTGVNETETETEGPSGPPRSSRAEERRPMSVEAISWALHLAPAGRGGQSPHRMQVRARRPSQPRRAGQHAPVLLCRWLAPVPVHLAIAVPRSPSVKSLILRAAMNRASLPNICSCSSASAGGFRGAEQPALVAGWAVAVSL